MQIIQASEFNAKCLALMYKIAAFGETLVVTKKRETYRGDEALFWETGNLPIRTPSEFNEIKNNFKKNDDFPHHLNQKSLL